MARWSAGEVLDRLSSVQGRKLVVVRETLASFALLRLAEELGLDVLYVDTWVGYPWIRSFLLSKVPELGGRVITPDPPYIFFSLLFGRGYPPPHEDFRWHTRRVRVDPIRDYLEREPYDILIMDTRLSDLPEDKRGELVIRGGVGVGFLRGANRRALFPLAAASIADVVDLAWEVGGPVSALVSAPNATCWLCKTDWSEKHALAGVRSDFYGAKDIYEYRVRLISGSERPENREVDEHGYPRSLTPDFRRAMYSAYQSLASRLSHRVPGYLPVLPPLETLES